MSKILRSLLVGAAILGAAPVLKPAHAQMSEPSTSGVAARASSAGSPVVIPTTPPNAVFIPMMDAGVGPAGTAGSRGVMPQFPAGTVFVPMTVFIPMMDGGPGPEARAASPSAPR
jgi:hypothetical protein